MFRSSIEQVGAIRAPAQVRPPVEDGVAFWLGRRRAMRLARRGVALDLLDLAPAASHGFSQLLRRNAVKVAPIADHAREPYRFLGHMAPPFQRASKPT